MILLVMANRNKLQPAGVSVNNFPMIIPKLYGRLGNQAFQISAAIAHAKKMNTKWAVPSKTLDRRIWPTYFKDLPNGDRYAPMHLYKELRHCFNELPPRKDMLLEGYFQSEKYWPTNEEKCEIGDALGFHCNRKDYIAIHIRRGDYLHYPDQFPVLAVEYYQTAIDYYLEQGAERFKIYSDDQTWVRNYFKPKFQWAYVEYSNITDPLTDMRDMYNAAGFIISNSTFSLFPALLRLDQPVTIAPAEHRWFGPKNSHLETYDLMPERFIKI